jgi:predicted DNA-binding transcriptional regulator AlpA
MHSDSRFLDPELNTADAARFLGISVSTLERLRASGDGPRFAKYGPRTIRYKTSDLCAWREAHTFNNLSEARQAEGVLA